MIKMINYKHHIKKLVVFASLVLGLLLFSACSTQTIDDSKEFNDGTNTANKNEASGEDIAVFNVMYNENDFLEVEELNPINYFKPPKVKGLYVTGHIAGIESKLDELIKIADETEINAFVIDVKSDGGRITYDMDVPSVQETGSIVQQMRDIDSVLDKLYEHNIYPIARVVTFKDQYLAKNRQEYAIKNKNGGLWFYKKIPWLNPYNKNSWSYIMDVATRAGLDGFKEIQFDYIRFEATRTLENATFEGYDNGKTRKEIILEYVNHTNETLKPLGLLVSADVFGIVITSEFDSKNLGQDYLLMSENLDVICPMVYPSHYGFGFFGIPRNKHTDLFPYETIKGSMDASTELLATSKQEKVAIVRPWLQAFSAPWIGKGNYLKYGKKEVRDQIQATYDAGLEEWILWNSGVRYNKDWFLKEDEASGKS